jgi:tRNA dimethylallyltransferase
MMTNETPSKPSDSLIGETSKRQLALGCWYLTGATASGKTGISLALAELLDAEIISLDSMAIYRGMDVGTAKPVPAQQAQVQHHLIDIIDPVDSFSVSDYRDRAIAAIQQIRSRGKEVLFVGGTALYLKALLRGLFDGPPADWEFRKQIESELANVDVKALHQRLEMVDPVTASRVHINDRRRIIRALEVYRQTGTPISHWQIEFDEETPAEKCRVFTIRWPRHVLHQRIERRVEQMFANGLVKEVRSLLEKWTQLGHTASQAVGYREAIEYLGGHRNLKQTVEKVRVRTRRFARHQETWFRGLRECRMIDLVQPTGEHEVAQRLFEMGSWPNG